MRIRASSVYDYDSCGLEKKVRDKNSKIEIKYDKNGQSRADPLRRSISPRDLTDVFYALKQVTMTSNCIMGV